MSRLATEAVTDPNRRLEAVDMSAEAVTIARGLGDPDLLASTLSKHCSVVMASFTDPRGCASISGRSEEHTSELQSLMRISYAVFCLKKKKDNNTKYITCIT